MGQSKKIKQTTKKTLREKSKTPPSRYEAASAMDLHALDDSFSEEQCCDSFSLNWSFST